jgi:hypothetical protein
MQHNDDNFTQPLMLLAQHGIVVVSSSIFGDNVPFVCLWWTTNNTLQHFSDMDEHIFWRQQTSAGQ